MIEIENYIPVRECKHELKNDIVSVIYDRYEKTWLDKLIKPKEEKVAYIELDKIGSFVWLSCDGKRKVSDIIELTKNEYPDSEKIEERVKLYFTHLETKKFIRFYTIK